jgi:hypothetical protein
LLLGLQADLRALLDQDMCQGQGQGELDSSEFGSCSIMGSSTASTDSGLQSYRLLGSSGGFMSGRTSFAGVGGAAGLSHNAWGMTPSRPGGVQPPRMLILTVSTVSQGWVVVLVQQPLLVAHA